jgi:hypothetical protein
VKDAVCAASPKRCVKLSEWDLLIDGLLRFDLCLSLLSLRERRRVRRFAQTPREIV